MMLRPLPAVALAILCWLSFAGMAMAQSKGCTVEQAPPLNFGLITANPTTEKTTSTAVTVRCAGAGAAERGSTIKVCLKLNGQPTGQMASGLSVLGYQIHGNSPNGPVSESNQTADALLTLDQSPQPTGAVTITLCGVITANQMGLEAGTYTQAINGEVLSTTNTSMACAPVIQAPLITSASAELPDSCSIVADDLAFGNQSSLALGVDAAAGIRLTCTADTAWSVGINGGSSGDPANRRMRRNGIGPESVGYGLYHDDTRIQPWGNTPATSASGTGTGSQQLLTVHGQVPAQPQPLSGDYQDTVRVTVVF
ncbi:MAG TPA: spore coat U domain-containing protein [Lysobacter sp.]|nr:spore coat U domain-containing protein [Lysobacter sp.]